VITSPADDPGNEEVKKRVLTMTVNGTCHVSGVC
jgi:hypothetical protein